MPAETWKAEFCAGLDPAFVARTLASRGMVRRQADGKNLARAVAPKGGQKMRCYVLTAAILEGDEGRKMPMDVYGPSFSARVGRSCRSGQVFRAFPVVPARAQNQIRERPISPGFPGRNDRNDPIVIAEVPHCEDHDFRRDDHNRRGA